MTVKINKIGARLESSICYNCKYRIRDWGPDYKNLCTVDDKNLEIPKSEHRDGDPDGFTYIIVPDNCIRAKVDIEGENIKL